jgi:hypothetical protein
MWLETSRRYSVVVLPEDTATDKLRRKWAGQEEGFVEMVEVAAEPSLPALNKAFPKVAALAGFAKVWV